LSAQDAPADPASSSGGPDPDQLLVIPASLEAASGAGTEVYVLAVNSAGNLDTSYDSPVTLAVQDANGVDTGDAITANAVGGVAEFANVSIAIPGNGYVFEASGGTADPGSSPQIDVYPDQLAIAAGPPNTVPVGSSYPIVIEAQDGTGQVDASFNGQLTVTVDDPFSSSQGTTISLDAVKGIAEGTVTLSQVGEFGLTATSDGVAEAFSLVDVAPAVITAVATTITASEGIAFTGAVATFTDSNLADTLAATITWDDGTTSAGSISGPDANGNFTVVGTHTFAEETTGVAVSVTISDAAGISDTAASIADVADAPLTAGTASATAATEGVTASKLTATFSDANTAAPTSDFSGTIDWGDGTAASPDVTAFTSSDVAGSGGSYTVTAAHLYVEQGSYPVTITVNDVGGSTATITGTASVADASLSATGVAVSATAGATVSGTVATFTDADALGNQSDYSATIDWGDGTTASTVSGSAMTETAPGDFNVPGTHVYVEAGTFTLSVTVNDVGGSSTTATAVAAVVPALATPVITWTKPQDIIYGTALDATQLDAMATVSGNTVPGTFSYTLADDTTPAGGAVLNAGQNQTLNVTFTPTDSADYTTTNAQVQINVAAAPLTVTGSGTQVYGGSPTFAAAYNGFVLGQNSGVLGGTLAFTTTTTSSSNVGSYPNAVTPSGLTSTNYAISFAAGSMLVTPATLTVTGSGTQVYGGSPTFAATYSGFVLGQNSSVLGGTLAFTTTTMSSSNVGSYPNAVTPSGLTSTNYAISFAVGSMVITAAPLTVTGSGTQVYGGSPTFAAAYNGFVLGQSSSVLGGTLAFTTTTASSSNVGTYPNAVTPSGLTSTNYAISFAAGSMLVTQVPLTVTGNGTQVYGGSPTFTAAYSGFVLGQNSSVLGGTLAFATTTTSGSNVGTYPNAVTPSGLTSSNYTITFDAGSMQVTQATLTVTGGGTQVYGGNPTFAASYSGFVLGQTNSALGGTLAFTTTTTSSSNVRSYQNAVTPSGLTSTNYAISFAAGTMLVTPAPVTVTGSGTQVYGGSPMFAAAYSGFVLGQSSSVLGGTLAFTTTTTSSSPVGSYPNAVTPSGLTSTNYAISFDAGSMVVTPAALTVAGSGTQVYGGSPTFTAAYSGLVLGQTSSVLGGTLAFTTTNTSSSNVGNYANAVTPSGLTSTNYAITFAAGSMLVTPATLTITAEDKSKVYGAALPMLVASFSGFVNGDIVASLTTLPTLSTTATAASHVSGSPYTITASGAVDPDYTISYVPGALSVTPATLTVQANDASKEQGAPNPTFADTIAGFVNGDNSNVVSGAASLSTTATTASAVGSYPIVAALGTLSAADYDFVFQNGTLTVTSSTPFVVNDAVYTIGSGTITVPATSGVLANDSGPGQLTVTTGTATGANGGTFAFNADGSFTYTPPSSFPGFDYAHYSAQDTQGDRGTATVYVLSNTGALVWKFYESMLDRAPDNGGLSYWINAFNSGAALSQIAVNFFAGDELQTRVITDYYLQYLGRQPDAQGLAYWKARWTAAGGPEDVQAGFANSPEFTAQNDDTPSGWVTGLYEKILNRPPEQSGLNYWIGQVEQLDTQDGKSFVDDALARFTIADRILKSQERYQDIIVPGWFEQFDQRQPTPTELTTYVNELLAGTPDRTVEEQIIDTSGVTADVPAPAAGGSAEMPDFYYVPLVEQKQATVAATDAVFSQVGAAEMPQE
jgi:hypothetical protein